MRSVQIDLKAEHCEWLLEAMRDRQLKRAVQTGIKFEGVCGIDPGETTGLAIAYLSHHSNYLKIGVQQVVTGPSQGITHGAASILRCLQMMQAFMGVGSSEATMKRMEYIAESYRVYSWKAVSHSWSPVHTIQLIGGLQVAFDLHLKSEEEIMNPSLVTGKETLDSVKFQSAQLGKAFYTDEKLQLLELYEPTKGLPHARDALRHALHYMTFGGPNT